jgi:hypothetical protein
MEGEVFSDGCINKKKRKSKENSQSGFFSDEGSHKKEKKKLKRDLLGEERVFKEETPIEGSQSPQKKHRKEIDLDDRQEEVLLFSESVSASELNGWLFGEKKKKKKKHDESRETESESNPNGALKLKKKKKHRDETRESGMLDDFHISVDHLFMRESTPIKEKTKGYNDQFEELRKDERNQSKESKKKKKKKHDQSRGTESESNDSALKLKKKKECSDKTRESGILDDSHIGLDNLFMMESTPTKKKKERHGDQFEELRKDESSQLEESIKEEPFSPLKEKKKKHTKNAEVQLDERKKKHDESRGAESESNNSAQKLKKKKECSDKTKESGISDDSNIGLDNLFMMEPTPRKKKKQRHGDQSEELRKDERSQLEEPIKEPFSPPKKKKKRLKSDESVMSIDFSILAENLDTSVEDVMMKTKKKKHRNKNIVEEHGSRVGLEKGESLVFGNTENVDDGPVKNNICANGKTITENSYNDGGSKKSKETQSSKDNSPCAKTESNSSGGMSGTTVSPQKMVKGEKHTKNKFKKLLADLEVNDYCKPKTKLARRRQSVFVESTSANHELSPTPCQSEVCENKSLEELLENMEDEYRLDERELNRLNDLSVLLPWVIPPLHLIETRVTLSPTASQKVLIEALDIDVKMGKFSHLEDEQIKKNWDEFCELHDIPHDPTPFLVLVNKDLFRERLKFVQFLAHGLENRLLCSVYKRFKRLFSNQKHKSGRFTAQENWVIVEYMTKTCSRTPYADLARILNRDKLAVEKRCARLLGKKEPVKWNLKKIGEFMGHLADITDVSDPNELKYRPISTEEWQELSEVLKVPVMKLRRAWLCTIHPRLFVKKSMKYNVIKENLVVRMIENHETDWRTVNWDEIAKDFEGFTGAKLNKLIKELVSYHVPKEKQSNLKESLQFLNENVIKQNQLRNHKLRKIKMRQL